MNKQPSTAISASIIALVATSLDVAPATLSQDSGPASVAEWDSLAHVTVITAAEKAFGVEFAVDEMLSINSIANLCQLIETKLR